VKRSRLVNTRIPRTTTLIICEGGVTEPAYFESIRREYRLTNIKIEGGCGDPSNILKICKSKKNDYDSIWLVFDRDAFVEHYFDNTIHACLNNKKFYAAWSNQSFELWYVLHFQFLNTATAGPEGTIRSYYMQRLNSPKCLGEYEKNLLGIWDILKEKLPTAIRNAERLILESDKDLPFHQQVPVTYVVELIKKLIPEEEYQKIIKANQ
jgi:hypothetical protein